MRCGKYACLPAVWKRYASASAKMVSDGKERILNSRDCNHRNKNIEFIAKERCGKGIMKEVEVNGQAVGWGCKIAKVTVCAVEIGDVELP